VALALAVTVSVALSAGALAACSEDAPADEAADNATSFKERVMDSGIDAAFVPVEETRPGLVAGVARSRDGVRAEFIFSFGPGPDKLPSRLQARGTTWVDLGDRLEYWVEPAPRGLTGEKASNYVDMVLELEDIGCRVVANRPCLN
jgi:hypothetical protein